jgi:D-alanyl-D-alanine carboxypeptidase/D-alanyl-D-alanine-endopeptidase (penicillin-binding protein 4)
MSNQLVRALGVFLILTSLFSCSRTRWNHSFHKSPLSKLASGILIQDLNTGKVIFSHQADQFFMPASNAKLATFLMAKSFLGDSIPSFAYLENRDTLFFWGTGDPTQLNPSFKNTSLIDNLSKCTKVLVYCVPQKEIAPLGSGWSWDDYNDSYSAEISSLPLYGNLVGFSVKNQNWETAPRYFKSAISGTHSFNYVLRDRLKNEFTLPTLKSEWKVQQVPFVTSATLTAKLLVDTLKKDVVVQRKAMNPLAKIQYAGLLDSLYVPMLHESDNMIAEQLLLLIGAKYQWSGGAQDIISRLKKESNFEFLKAARWVDGSGLSRYNLFRPKDFIEILTALSQKVEPTKLHFLLPRSGRSGTLKSVKLKSDDHVIWAKSGSFSNTYDLSGFFQNSKGKTYVFSIMTNLANHSVAESKRDVINFLENLD